MQTLSSKYSPSAVAAVDVAATPPDAALVVVAAVVDAIAAVLARSKDDEIESQTESDTESETESEVGSKRESEREFGGTPTNFSTSESRSEKILSCIWLRESNCR